MKPINTTNNVYQLSSRESLVKVLHQYPFSTPKNMLFKALYNNKLPTWTFNKETITKYLPGRSPATDKGSMKHQ